LVAAAGGDDCEQEDEDDDDSEVFILGDDMDMDCVEEVDGGDVHNEGEEGYFVAS